MHIRPEKNRREEEVSGKQTTEMLWKCFHDSQHIFDDVTVLCHKDGALVKNTWDKIVRALGLSVKVCPLVDVLFNMHANKGSGE